jgi:glycosyltransferase involved in cell wall biosynthesis
MEKITFVIPSRNNLELLKLAYKSIIALEGEHHVLVLNDASEDGTGEWLESMICSNAAKGDNGDNHLHVYSNPGPERVGIVGMFDKGIEMAETDIIMAFHADMVAGKDLDKAILKHLERGKVVTATRIEPSLHPPGPEKVIEDFGLEPEEFNFDKWLEYKPPTNRAITQGIFAPWCMYKDDFLAIGGHDELFAPQSREDSDLFNRFYLKGYELLQTWEGFVYHFTSRGSRFNKYSGGDIGKDSPEWQDTNAKNMRNFFRKWKTNVQHDPYMLPIVDPIYDVGFVVANCDLNALSILEPWCDDIYSDWVGHKGFGVNKYIDEEQPRTTYDLNKKIHSDHIEPKNDIIVKFDAKNITQDDFACIQKLGAVLEDSGTVGEMKFGNLHFKIKKLEQIQHKNIQA